MHSKFLEARNYIDCNRLDEARRVLEEYSETDVLCLYGLYVLIDMGFICDEQDKERIEKRFSNEFTKLESIVRGDDSEAVYTLGVCYERGYIAERNLRKAMQCYRRAYKKGHLRAGFNLAYCYQRKNELREVRKAISVYKELAEKGMTEAMTNLGVIYSCYKPCIDLEAAKHFFKCASDMGDELAAQHLKALGSMHVQCANCKKD